MGSVELIAHEINKNLCGGLNTSIEYFLKNGKDGDLMCLMDGDATHSPKYIHNMIKKLNTGKDCIIASRYCKESNVVGVAAHREFMSDMAKLYYSMVLKVPNVKDYTCGYRLYTWNSVQRMVNRFGKDPIKEKSFACMMEFLYKLYLTGTTFDEVGFELRYDKKQGESKMKVFTTMRKSLSTAWKLRRIKNNQEKLR
jgi:dolichol-phosphate mannosyltransferase